MTTRAEQGGGTDRPAWASTVTRTIERLTRERDAAVARLAASERVVEACRQTIAKDKVHVSMAIYWAVEAYDAAIAPAESETSQ